MKKIILLGIVFLCSTLGIAQKTISKEDFEHLVDYANCKYVKAFIEKYDVNKPYFKDTYEKKVKPELDKSTLSDLGKITNFQKIKELLSNNIPACKLAETINEKKKEYDNIQSNKILIEALKATKWKGVDLITTADIVLNTCFKKYDIIGGISAQEIVQEQTIQTSTEVEELQSKLDQLQQEYDNLIKDTRIIEYQKSFKNFRFIVFCVLGLLIIIFLVLTKVKLREYIIKEVLGSERISEKFLPSDISKLTESDINRIVGIELNKLQNKDEDINRIVQIVLSNLQSDNENKIKINEKSDFSKSVSRFLKGKSGKIFNRAENTPENSFFKILNEDADTAQFEFCGDESEAIAKRIFSEDICTIISGNYQNANSVENVEPGKIKSIDGQKWEVTAPVKIKFK